MSLRSPHMDSQGRQVLTELLEDHQDPLGRQALLMKREANAKTLWRQAPGLEHLEEQA